MWWRLGRHVLSHGNHLPRQLAQDVAETHLIDLYALTPLQRECFILFP